MSAANAPRRACWARTVVWRRSRSRLAVDRTSRPSTDSGQSLAVVRSAPPARAKARWCWYEAYAATIATAKAPRRRAQVPC